MLETITHALKGKKTPPKQLKEFNAKELHSGGYHVMKHSGNPAHAKHETHAGDLGEVQAMLEDHMGQPNEGEAELEPAGMKPGGPVGT